MILSNRKQNAEMSAGTAACATNAMKFSDVAATFRSIASITNATNTIAEAKALSLATKWDRPNRSQAVDRVIDVDQRATPTWKNQGK